LHPALAVPDRRQALAILRFLVVLADKVFAEETARHVVSRLTAWRFDRGSVRAGPRISGIITSS
jgi:hypothetical protein